ncbi:MAG: hypothetical protein ABSF81_06935 [Bacteroidales bacterium]
MATNKHGLSRIIPSEVKRQIRQNCGFGCVICGLGIYDYEHVDPEFPEAEMHDPNKMTLLCMQCHGKVSRKMWSKDKVKLAMQDPYCKKSGYSNEYFDFGTNFPTIQFAGSLIQNCSIPILVYGESLFEIKPPEENGAPFRLSGNFYNRQGNDSLKIIDNEWFASTDNWDVEIIGPVITIRESSGNVHLQLTSVPPYGIIVSKLNMKIKNITFEGDKDSLNINYPDGRKRELSGCFMSGFPVALSIGPSDGYIVAMSL